MIKTNFSDDKVLKKKERYTRIACITTDSVMRMKKKNYPKVYLEECNYKMKRRKNDKNGRIHTSRNKTRVRARARVRVRVRISHWIIAIWFHKRYSKLVVQALLEISFISATRN